MTYYFWAVCKTTFSLPIYIFDKLNARTTLRWSEIDFAVIRCSCSLLKRNNFKYFSLVFVEDKTENFVTRTFRSFDRSREYYEYHRTYNTRMKTDRHIIRNTSPYTRNPIKKRADLTFSDCVCVPDLDKEIRTLCSWKSIFHLWLLKNSF